MKSHLFKPHKGPSKILLAVGLMLFLCNSYSQTHPIRNNQKISAAIEHNYESYNLSPDNESLIKYTIHVHGGSGNYVYSWKIQNSGWTSYETNANYIYKFDCDKIKRPESFVHCKIKDVNTGKIELVEKRHVVELCNNRKL